jgi:putative ABC transport system permease protein
MHHRKPGLNKMGFGSFIFKNLLRRKFRALLTAVGVAIAIAAVVALLGVSSGLQRSAAERFESRGVDLVVQRAGVAQQLNSSLSESIGARLRKLDGVKGVAPGLTDMVSFDDSSFIGVPIHGWPADSFAFTNLDIVKGRKFAAGEVGKVMLGNKLAAELKKDVGDDLSIEGSTFKVLAIYESANMFDNGSGVIPLANLQDLMDRKGQVTEFQVAIAGKPESRKQVVERLSAEIAALRDDQEQPLGLAALSTEEFIQKNTEIKLIEAMAWITSAIALVIGSVGMLNTMIMSVLERTQEIGILRAIGWKKARIVGMVLSEAFLLSLIGAVMGVLFAMALTWALAHASPVQTYVRSDLSPTIILAGFALAAGVALVGGAYPAIRGASLPPTEALRTE